MAVKIKLQRLGKVRAAEYRVVIADARTRRNGKVIENIGIYHPKEEPSLIQIDSERAQHWLSVGAQPTEPVLALLKVTGDWQKHKGEAGAEGTLKAQPEKPTDRQHSVRLCVGNGMRPDIWDEFRERFGIDRIVELTEGKNVVKKIYVPGRMVNLVVK